MGIFHILTDASGYYFLQNTSFVRGIGLFTAEIAPGFFIKINKGSNEFMRERERERERAISVPSRSD
jgi:hypothetical protein